MGKNTGEGLASWEFEKDEPRTISLVEEEYEGDKATIIIDMQTEGSESTMAGKLRLHYEWIADEWNLVRVENLTFKET